MRLRPSWLCLEPPRCFALWRQWGWTSAQPPLPSLKRWRTLEWQWTATWTLCPIHIDGVSQKCTGMLIALMHARHVIPRSVLKQVIEALVISVLRYCLSVYGSCGETQLQRLQKVVNFCARVVSDRMRRDSVSAVIKQLKWLTAKQLVTYHTCVLLSVPLYPASPSSSEVRLGTELANDTRTTPETPAFSRFRPSEPRQADGGYVTERWPDLMTWKSNQALCVTEPRSGKHFCQDRSLRYFV